MKRIKFFIELYLKKMNKAKTLLWLVTIFCCFQVLGIEQSTGNDSIVDGPKITRSEIILTAHKFTRIHWRMEKVNQTSKFCNGNFKSEYSLGLRIGMGYMWGGWDDIDEFMDKIISGHGTGTGGNVSYEEYSKDCVTGISCTGLVSRAWHLNQKYTLNYPDYPEIKEQFYRITYDIANVDFSSNKTDLLKKGDAFINKWHIILFVYETRDGTAMIMDSRSSGVGFRKMSWRKLAENDYKAIRYNNINEINNPLGTIQNPIHIDSDNFPIKLSNNTRDFVSMEFDRYSINPNFNEQGPEVIYELQVKSKSDIDIILNEVNKESIDNNIYLLKSLKRNNEYNAIDCIARGDVRISKVLDPGTYFIIIDSGKDKPGEYELIIKK